MNLTNFQYIQNYLEGSSWNPFQKPILTISNPATGEKFGQIPNSNSEDVELAVRAAEKAFVSWSISSPEHQFKVLNKIAELINAHIEELALAETTDNGKPIWLSKRVDIPEPLPTFVFLPPAYCILRPKVM